ncbi:MAG: bifunctional riboflavin kinase/FMN adenylyltransferase, partial [Lachnospiraceae bacterium]|nr:bifunctional riboflavin kinase/FMN adenylyltransferase [Lachnospiraceae bacterium]
MESVRVIANTTDFKIEEPTAVAIGKFDGIHRGHKELLAHVIQAKREGLKAAVFTFDTSPEVFFKKVRHRELMTAEEKRACFEKMGIDYVVEYPFNEETARISPQDYVKEFLLEKMSGRLIVAGEDLSYGDKGAGDANLLVSMAGAHG